VAPFAQCDQLGELTAQQRVLCDSRPVEQRPGPEWYLWSDRNSQVNALPDATVLGFARKVIAHQPLDYLQAVAGGTAHVFYPGQRQRSREPCVAHWAFPDPLPGRCRADRVGSDLWREHPVTVDRTLAHGLSQYGRLDYLVGPAFLACVLVALLALVWRPRAGGARARLDAALLAAVGLAVTIAAIATANFSYRYTVPLYSTLPIAAAIALTHLAAMRRRARQPVPASA
jgi:hypothetical protein